MFAIDRARKVSTLVITCIGFFMVLLDASIVTVALPTIQRDLHASLSELQWVVDAYTLPFAVLLLTAGTLGDRFGRKRLFLVGLGIFTIGSALCGLAPTFGLLVAGRVIQGVGGAALSPGSLSVLASAFPEPRERARVIGIWSGVSGIALAAGPLVGGLLIQISSWSAIFFINVPIGLVALVLGWRVLKESRNPDAKRVDLPGQVLIVAGLTSLTYALIEGNSQGWASPFILTLFAASALFICAFLIVEARVKEPLLPLFLFKNAVFSAANIAATVVGFALLGTVFFIAQYFQGIQGYTALGSGLRTLPTTMGIFIAAPVAGWLTSRFGPRLPVTAGALLSGTALLLLTSIEPTTDYMYIWWKFVMLGTGFGLMLSPLTVAVLASTPRARAGLASSMVNTSRQIGGVLGIALLGALVANQFSSNILHKLTVAGIPSDLAQKISTTIAGAGTLASRVPLPGKLPIAAPVLHTLISISFTDAIHAGFIVSGVALLGTAVLSASLLGGVQREVDQEKIATQDIVPGEV
jgi:EmrB/QacA subfamily drug resistance transporter